MNSEVHSELHLRGKTLLNCFGATLNLFTNAPARLVSAVFHLMILGKTTRAWAVSAGRGQADLLLHGTRHERVGHYVGLSAQGSRRTDRATNILQKLVIIDVVEIVHDAAAEVGAMLILRTTSWALAARAYAGRVATVLLQALARELWMVSANGRVLLLGSHVRTKQNGLFESSFFKVNAIGKKLLVFKLDGGFALLL